METFEKPKSQPEEKKSEDKKRRIGPDGTVYTEEEYKEWLEKREESN